MSAFSAGKAAIPGLTLAVIVFILLVSRLPAPGQVLDYTAPIVPSPEPTASQEMTVAIAPTSTPAPTPTPAPSPVRIVIPAIDVDAPVTEVGVTPDGTVEEPRGPDEVAWTNGSARPGTGGNAVLSGHLDWSLPAPRGAVFWYLSSLKLGDKARIYLSDGSELIYEVESTTRYLAASAPGEKILAPSTRDIITLITCEGTFYREIHDYSHRRVVVARRVQS
ncbi:MAG: class F sortase [Chloroflexi bacterium]|nr:class F sortase [Chloroflexota bacterium]